MRNGVRMRRGSRVGNEQQEEEQGWAWGVGWDVAPAVEQEPEHRALPGFRTRRDEAVPVPVPPRPHCLGAGAEEREAQAERREAPAAPAPAASADGPAMAPAPRLALLAAALLCTPGKWEQHREWHRERQLAPGTGTDPDPAPHPSRRPAGIRSRVVLQSGSILPFPHLRGPSVPPGAGETSPPPPLSLRTPGSVFPIPRGSVPSPPPGIPRGSPRERGIRWDLEGGISSHSPREPAARGTPLPPGSRDLPHLSLHT